MNSGAAPVLADMVNLGAGERLLSMPRHDTLDFAFSSSALSRDRLSSVGGRLSGVLYVIVRNRRWSACIPV
jgi:hypothetical protein